MTINAKVDEFHNKLTKQMDKLASLKRKRVTQDMKQPWYNKHLTKEIELRRHKEMKWKTSGNEYYYNALQEQKGHVSKL